MKGLFRIATRRLGPRFAIFQEIRRAQADDGRFLFRLNASGDVNTGAEGTEDSWECVEVRGVSKQFFTEQKISEVLEGLYAIKSIELIVTARFERPKAIYEVAAEAI